MQNFNHLNLKKTSFLKDKDHLAFLLISIFITILLFLNSPFSPFHKYCFEYDATAYKTVACGILKGKIPYKDLFDHKGPLTYFILALGFAISNCKNWGAWIVVTIINIATYIIGYKMLRLKYNFENSFSAIAFFILITNLTLYNIFSTGTRPENFLLLPLMISSYIYVKGIVESDNDTNKIHVFSNMQMFVMGLMCGLVFMIKLNVCAIYFLFIAPYYLWLLIKKQIFPCIKLIFVFLFGVILACLPFIIYLKINNSISSFIEVYLKFNFDYSSAQGKKLYFFQIQATDIIKFTVVILLFLSLICFYFTIKNCNKKFQTAIYFILGFISFIGLTLSVTCDYFFIIYMPMLLFVTAWLAQTISKHFKLNVNSNIEPITILSIIILIVNIISNLYLLHITPQLPIEYEESIDVVSEYLKDHPNATLMSFSSLARPALCDIITTLPNTRIFYAPPYLPRDLFNIQLSDIHNQIPDIIIFEPADFISAEALEAYTNVPVESGYELYFHNTSTAHNIYIWTK